MEYVDLKRGMTVEEAFDRIRAIGVEKRRCTPATSRTAAAS